jgi:hypothetical protein
MKRISETRLIFSSFAFILVLLFMQERSLAQNNPVTGKDSSGFKTFKENWENAFDQYVKDNDSLFLSYLEDHWKDFELFVDSARHMAKPKFQPVMTGRSDRDSFDLKKPDTAGVKEKKTLYQMMIDTVQGKNSFYRRGEKNGIDFYGENPGLNPVSSLSLSLPVDPLNIITFYRNYLKDPDLIQCSKNLKNIAVEIGLNDYGRFLLIQKVSAGLFAGMNERVLFTWITLSREGKDVKVGYNNGSVYMLISCDYPLSDQSFVLINGRKYYLITFSGQIVPKSALKSYEVYYPGTVTPVSIRLQKIPVLKKEIYSHTLFFRDDTIRINTSLFLVSFLKDLPGSNLDYYFNSPVSEIAMESLDKGLLPLLSGKTDLDKINILLAFMQKSFDYKTDQEQFGREKFMFCDESLYYPYTDCDDRAVLFSHFVKRYTHLSVVGLEYPEHVSTAVHFDTFVQGDSVKYNGQVYIICDPTCKNAKAGMATRSMNSTTPAIIQIMD